MLNAGVFPLEMDAVCIFLRLKFLPVLCRPFETSKGNLAKTLSRFCERSKMTFTYTFHLLLLLLLFADFVWTASA